MIDQVLTFLKGRLIEYLKLKAGTTDNKIDIMNIVSQDGTIGHLPNNSIIMTLVNVEEEKIGKSQIPFIEQSCGKISKVNPEIKINLYLLFSAKFDEGNYIEALKFLSYIVYYFQGKNVFNHQNSPELYERIEKIVVELLTLNFEQQNHLWGALGAKYMPSVVYKIRMLTVQGSVVKTQAPPISEAELKNS